MKNRFLVFWIFISIKIFAQDTIVYKTTHSQFFSLSPISKKVDRVNGFAFGFGHVENKLVEKQTINGLNIEANPAPFLGALVVFMSIPYFPDIIKNNSKKMDTIHEHNFKIKNWNYKPDLKINGINISSGCFFTTTSMSGLNISLANQFKNFNGLTIAPIGTRSDKLNGISIGIININNDLKGASFGLYNQTYELKGLQFGFINQVEKSKGIQIGIYNNSYSRGLQIGIWNKNTKCSFPILNW
jgi:hypothetical protein